MFLPEEAEVYLWKRSSGAGALRGHGKHSGDAQCHSGRSRVHIDPKRHPGQDDDQEGGDVHLDQVVAHLALQVEFHFNTGEFSCLTQTHHMRILAV